MLDSVTLPSGLVVEISRSKGLFHLKVFDGPNQIGEYERTIEKNITRKLKEIDCFSAKLKELYRSYGPFRVRWSNKQKEVRNLEDQVVGFLPTRHDLLNQR